MTTIIIEEHYQYQNVIFQAVLNKDSQVKLKEVLVWSHPAQKWVEGSGLAIRLSFFKKQLPSMEYLTNDQFKKHQANEQ